jgi:hypothetical protein
MSQIGRCRFNSHFVACIGMLALCPVFAQAPDQPAQADHSRAALNSPLFAALDALNQAGNDNPEALLHLQAVAMERQQALQDLMSSYPAAVIAAALSDDVRGGMPPAVQDLIEQHVKLEGEAEVSIEDGPDYSRIHYGLLVAGERLELHFADQPPANLSTGDQVQVEGVQLGGDLALTSTSTTTTSTTTSTVSILPNSFGAQKTLVILVNFQDLTTQPYTTSTAYSTTFTSVSNFYLNNSFQQTRLTGDVAGWYTIPVSSTTCDTASIETYALQAAQAAGYVPGNYAHHVYGFPQTSACAWWGLSNVGGNPSNSWINGSYQLKVVGHELGHAFGLYHSHSLSCGTAVYATSGCTSTEYGDTVDMMGNPTSDDFTAPQKERLGWLNYGGEPPLTTVSVSGTYALTPYETQDLQTKALKIAGPNGTYYYVESRQATGDDSSLSGNTNVLSGVVLHNYTPGSPNTSYLLNATPGGSWSNPALDVGKSYTDSIVGVTIAPVSATSSGASVQITFGPLTCTHVNPAISIVGPSTSVAPGTTANFTVKITNSDTSACSSSTFALGQSAPAGWTAAYSGSSSVTLAPGGNTSATLQVTAPNGTANGTYSIAASANNLSVTTYTALASATETIYTTPVSITSPTAGAMVSGTTSINASASGVVSVSFSVDGVLDCTATASPYACPWNTSSAANGGHTLKATALDALGNASTASISVTVSNVTPDTTPPTVSMASPAIGSTVSGNVQVTVRTTDNVAVVKVELYVDGSLTATSTSAPFTTKWNTSPKGVAKGAHALQTKAYDAAGNAGTSTSIIVYK